MGVPPREAIDHTSGRSQQWGNVDGDIRDWVDSIVEVLERLDALVGVYLHGSLAMGGFFRSKSDLDLIVVADDPLDDAGRRSLAVQVLAMFDRRPISGGIELSVVRHTAVEVFRHPAPYGFHFSEGWADDVRSGGFGPTGTDPDLAAHCAVARSRGIALAGRDPGTVFGDVPRWAYLDAIRDDLQWIVDGGILESPFYGVLNICRCAHVLADDPGAPPTKQEGAVWALEHLPEQYHQVVADALECYRSQASTPTAERPTHGHSWEQQPLLDIAAWATETLLSIP